MPELPEVEIVRQSLDKKIKQKKVKKVIVRNRNLRTKIPLNFPRFLEGKKIIKVKRFSKYLIICLSNQSYCLLHLGMSGTIHLIYNQKKSLVTNTSFYSSPTLPKKHNHVEIVFDDLKNNVILSVILAYMASEDNERASREKRVIQTRINPFTGRSMGGWPQTRKPNRDGTSSK